MKIYAVMLTKDNRHWLWADFSGGVHVFEFEGIAILEATKAWDGTGVTFRLIEIGKII